MHATQSRGTAGNGHLARVAGSIGTAEGKHTPVTGERRHIAVKEPGFADESDYLAALLAHGPPVVDEVMGARILATAGT